MADDRPRSRWRRRSLRAALPVVAIAAGAALAGCSVSVGGSDLDTGELETEIEDGLEAQGVPDSAVDCPDDVEAEEGDEFTCTATAPDGSGATILVTQTNDDGDVTWRIVNTTPAAQ